VIKFPNLRAQVFGVVVGLAALAAAPALAASFDLSPEQPTRIHTDKDDAAVAAIGKDFKFVKDGVLTIATNPWLPPISTYATDAKTVVGFDADLSSLLAESLGRRIEIVPVAWPDWPLGLTSGKYDAVLSNVTVTEARKEKFDFSTYRKDQLGFYVKADSTIASIKEPKDIAGLRVITDSGTNQEQILLTWNKQNVANGLKPVEVQYYDDDAVRSLAIQSGRADVVFSVNSTQAYQAATQGKIKQVGTLSGGWPRTAEVAVTTRKGSGLADALTLAINDLIADGKYAKLLAKWSLSSEAIDKSQSNPLGLTKS
jgi:polar amino acid transport system substrate-binding protein